MADSLNNGKAPPKSGLGAQTWIAATWFTGGVIDKWPVEPRLGDIDAASESLDSLQTASPNVKSVGVAALLKMYEASAPSEPLWRGIRVGPSTAATLEPGSTFSSNFASWSRDENIARSFSKPVKSGGEPGVVLRMKSPKKALNIQPFSGKYKSQQESLAGGQLTVVGVETIDGVKYVDVEQVDPLDFTLQTLTGVIGGEV